MTASAMRYMLALASAAAALPGLPHPIRAADLPIATAVLGDAQHASAPNGAPLPFGSPCHRVSRIRLLEEKKMRGTYPQLIRAVEPAPA